MKKQKGEKKLKRDAFMSFLQTTATPVSGGSSVIQPKKQTQDNQEAYEQYTEQFNNCNVCGNELQAAKKKKCEFCTMPACNDHMRKRRKKKGKWEKICDNCEDKYLYDAHMKLQTKADEALAVQEEITLLKHDNFAKEVEERREKRRQLGFKTMSLQQKYQQEMLKITNEQNRLMSLEHQVESTELTLKQMQTFVERVNASFKENHQQSFNILSQQNSRMAKQLAKLQKKVMQIKSGIDKKQKQIENAFEAWEQKQFKKKLQQEQKAAKKKKQACDIY